MILKSNYDEAKLVSKTSLDLAYNLSDVTEQKNKDDGFDNWMGQETEIDKYDWMQRDTSRR